MKNCSWQQQLIANFYLEGVYSSKVGFNANKILLQSALVFFPTKATEHLCNVTRLWPITANNYQVISFVLDRDETSDPVTPQLARSLASSPSRKNSPIKSSGEHSAHEGQSVTVSSHVARHQVLHGASSVTSSETTSGG